ISTRLLTPLIPVTAATREATASAPPTCQQHLRVPAPSAPCRHGRAGSRRATPAVSAAWAPARTTPLPPASVPGRARAAAGRDRRAGVALALRPGMTFLSRTNRGLRPVAALLPRVGRAQAVSPVPRLAVPGRAGPRRDRPEAVLDARDGQTPGTGKDPIPAMTRIPGTRLPVRDSGSGRARVCRTPRAARTTVPAGASAAQSTASGGTVRARQDPTSTVPMSTGVTSGGAGTATSS